MTLVVMRWGGDFNYRPLCLWLNIDYSFVEPQHTIGTNFFLPRFKYDKSKVKEYQLALIASTTRNLPFCNYHM